MPDVKFFDNTDSIIVNLYQNILFYNFFNFRINMIDKLVFIFPVLDNYDTFLWKYFQIEVVKLKEINKK